jgi:hypothetical protein
VTIRNGGLAEWGTAVRLDGASFNLIRGLDIAGPAGVFVRGGESNTIRSSVLSGRGLGLNAIDTDGLVVADSRGTLWRVTGNGARVVRNELDDSLDSASCLRVWGNRNRIADNRLFSCPEGSLLILAGADNEVIHNEVSDVTAPEASDSADGIRIGAFTAGTLVEGNFAHNNQDDGIDVRAGATRLKDNRSDQNGDFGIDAVSGVTDLGGNTASANGNALQCRNVFCQ